MFCLFQVLIWVIKSHQTKIKVTLETDLMSPYPVATLQHLVVQRYSGIASIPDQLLSSSCSCYTALDNPKGQK